MHAAAIDTPAIDARARDPHVDALRRLIADMPIAMFNTVAADGAVVSRPLQTLEFDADGVLWFATDAGSAKAQEIKRRPHVGLSYGDRRDNSFVSVSGPARVVRDRERIERLWSPAMSIFFPQGKDDPDLVLVRVEIERAEYWDGPGTLVGKMLYLAAAALTGNPGVMTDNAKVEAAVMDSGDTVLVGTPVLPAAPADAPAGTLPGDAIDAGAPLANGMRPDGMRPNGMPPNGMPPHGALPSAARP